jgi:hypothetical protein
MRPQREEEQCCVLSGGAIIGSSFYRNISLNKQTKNKKVLQAALVNKNCIKKTMYGNNRMENMSVKLTIL